MTTEQMDWIDDHRGENYQPTPAQETMRREMEQPASLGAVLDETLGPVNPDKAVEAMAMEIIHHGPSDLRLSMKQWASVQSLIEQGVQAGYKRGTEDSAADRG